MKIILILVGVVIFLGGAFLAFTSYVYQPKQAVTTDVELPAVAKDLPTVTPIEHATMALSWGELVLYTDPVGTAEKFAGQPEPAIILVTDIHGDHLSTSTLASVTATGTTLIAPQAVYDLLPEELSRKTLILNNGETVDEQGFLITAIPMYNLPESPESRHVKGRGNGYVIEKDNVRVYVAGDTAGIPEMRTLADIDMAFLPMNMPYTMSVEEAADAALAFAPRKAYPYHYRGQDGLADVARFRELVTAANPAIEVVLLNWYPAN